MSTFLVQVPFSIIHTGRRFSSIGVVVTVMLMLYGMSR